MMMMTMMMMNRGCIMNCHRPMATTNATAATTTATTATTKTTTAKALMIHGKHQQQHSIRSVVPGGILLPQQQQQQQQQQYRQYHYRYTNINNDRYGTTGSSTVAFSTSTTTTTTADTDTTSNTNNHDTTTTIDERMQQQKQKKEVFICKSLYRQMLRWCQQQQPPPNDYHPDRDDDDTTACCDPHNNNNNRHYNHHSNPTTTTTTNDLIHYFIVAPKVYRIPEYISYEAVRTILHHEQQQQQQTETITATIRTEADNPDIDSQPRPQEDVQRRRQRRLLPKDGLLQQIQSLIQYDHTLRHSLIIPVLRNSTDVKHCVRSFFRFNNNTTTTTTTNSTNTKTTTVATQQQQQQQQQEQYYNKLRRDRAFDELKHMNEISNAVHAMRQQRQWRIAPSPSIPTTMRGGGDFHILQSIHDTMVQGELARYADANQPDGTVVLDNRTRDDFLTNVRTRQAMITPMNIGQVVQHTTDRWRGVIIHWHVVVDHHHHRSTTTNTRNRTTTTTTKTKRSGTVRDDFSKLTMESFAMEEEEETDDDDHSTVVSSATATTAIPTAAPQYSIVYEIVLDNAYRQYFAEHDGGDHTDHSRYRYDSSSNNNSDHNQGKLFKQHLLNRTPPTAASYGIQTCITVVQPIQYPAYQPPPPKKEAEEDHGEPHAQPSSGSSSSSSSDVTDAVPLLEIVHDPHLCHIRNHQVIHQLFERYDTTRHVFVPNSYMSYTYPNWVPRNDYSSGTNSIAAETVTTTTTMTDSERQLIMSKMILQLQNLVARLESVIVKNFAVMGMNMDSSNIKNDLTNDHHRHHRTLMDVLRNLLRELRDLQKIQNRASILSFNNITLPKQLSLHLHGVELIALQIYDVMYNRRSSKGIIASTVAAHLQRQQQKGPEPLMDNDVRRDDDDDQQQQRTVTQGPKFQLGQIVRHSKYNFRGVIVGRDVEPIYNVSRWDGLRNIPNAKELPFYYVIPDQQDCIDVFGGERPTRYVCELNLEVCPPDQMHLDVDVDNGWVKLSVGSYRPPPFARFRYGYDSDVTWNDVDHADTTTVNENDYEAFELCMVELESVLSSWQYESSQLAVPQNPPIIESHTAGGDNFSGTLDDHSSFAKRCAVSVRDMVRLLKDVDNVDDSTVIRDSIKLYGKAHPNILLRTQFQYGIDLMVADNFEKARTVFRSIVMDLDPNYVEAWNYLANNENVLSLQKDAATSATKVLEFNENNIPANTQLGIIHFQNGEYKEAEMRFRKVLDLDPWSIVSSKLAECIELIKEEDDNNLNEE